MKAIIDQQRAYFNSNITKDIKFRIKQLRKLQHALKQNEKLLFDAIYQDFKKSEFDCYTNELAWVYHDIREAIKKVRLWSRTKRVKTNLVNFPSKSYIIPEPLGVTLTIGAWNYPYLLSFAPVVAAIAAGNTVILKPSELPENTSNAIAKIISDHFEDNYFAVVEGGISETTELLQFKFDKIFFTGSVPVGKIIYQAAAKHLTPVTLELGGKSPAFVTEDCNLQMAVKRLVWAKFLNAGQTCISPDYILVHESIKEKFLQLAKLEIENSFFSIENGNYVQIINEQNTQRIAHLIVKDKVYHGGSYNIAERYIEPTILTDITFEDAVMNDEIFGPIMPVISYQDLDETISLVKSKPKPLACYIFSNNSPTQKKILHEISFGGGGVNEAVLHITNTNMGYGGVGDSGMGTYHGEEGFKTFSHFKSILDKPTWFELNLKYYPHTIRKLTLIKLILGQK